MSDDQKPTSQTTTEARLREALANLLEADRAFLGADNICVYCDWRQHDDGHAPDCVITQAMEALL